MIERKVWIQCESCQSHILVSNAEKGKRILCPMCNNACTIPEQEAVPAEHNEEYEIKNQGLVDEFFSVCPNCHTPYRFPNSMNKQEMLCLKCHTLFMPSFSTESSERKIYYNTRNDKSITLYDKLKKNKVGHQLKGGISVCNDLATIAKNDAKGKYIKISKDLMIISIIFSCINAIPHAIVSNGYLKFLIFLFNLSTLFAITDGNLIYFRNMRNDSGTLGDFLACFSIQGLKFELIKSLYIFMYILIFLIPTLLLQRAGILYISIGLFIIPWIIFLLNFSVFYFIDAENMNSYQCIQRSIKIMLMNIFYIVGASIISCIKTYFKLLAVYLLLIVVGIPLGLFSFSWQILIALLVISSVPVSFYWHTQNMMMLSIVYELTRD